MFPCYNDSGGKSMKSNPRLYEINTVAWLYELSVRYDRKFTLGNVPYGEWDRFKELGFDYIWLMGVWKRSKAGVRIFKNEPEYAVFKSLFDAVLPEWSEGEDLVGSPYSVNSYEPDPLAGQWGDIDSARDELRRRGIGLILDFVPNHTAPDHPWVFEHPEYYIQVRESDYKQDRSAYLPIHRDEKTLYIAHGRDPYFPPWTDTVQLNYFNPEMRSAMIRELRKISDHCDGVRCDMAMLVLNNIFHRTWGWVKRQFGHEFQGSEFWSDVRRELGECLLIAEAYWDTEAVLLSLGFDYVYDKRLYDHIRNASPSEVIGHLRTDVSLQEKFVRFIENHDEPRSAGVFRREKLMASAVMLSTLPGMRFYHHGQLEGRKIRLPVQLRKVQDEACDAGLYAFYEKLLSVTKLNVVSDGRWELKDVLPVFDESSGNLVAYTWTTDRELVLVVVNLSGQYSQGRISLAKEITSPGSDYILADILNEEVYKRNASELTYPGLHVILDAWHSHIFHIMKDL
jgi:glycosidase